MMSYRQKILLKVTITVALLGFLFNQMDLLKFVRILMSADLGLVLLAALIHIASVFLSVARWRTILRNFEIRVDFGPLTKITFIGYFFNLFLPSGIGGDFFRAYYLSRRKNRGMSTTLMSTVLERSAGLCALLAIGTVFAALYGIEFEGIPLRYVFLMLVVFYVLANVIVFHPWLHGKIRSWLRRKNLVELETKMELVYDGLNALRRSGRSIFVLLGLSVVIQLVASVIVWLGALAIAIEAPFTVFLVFVPLINLSIMVPLTINGIGLRESLFYLLFSQIGIPVETSVSLSLVTFAVYLLTALPGVVVYSFYKKEEHLDEILAQAEPG